VQGAVDRKLPLEVRKMGVAYVADAARVSLRADGRVAVDADVTATALKRSAKIHLVGSGVPVYRGGEFFLTEFKVDDAQLVRTEVRETERRLIAGALARVGVDNPEALWESNKEALIARVRETGGDMIRDALDKHPVYRLKAEDWKQSLTRLALREVKVSGGELVVTLDPMSALTRLLLWGVVVVLLALAGAGVLMMGGIFGLAAVGASG